MKLNPNAQRIYTNALSAADGIAYEAARNLVKTMLQYKDCRTDDMLLAVSELIHNIANLSK